MKKILWLFLIMPVILVAQKREFEITGKIGTYNSPYNLSVTYRAKGVEKIISSDLRNGVFNLKGTVDSIQIAYLIFKNPDNKQGLSEAVRFWLEPGKIQVNSTAGIGRSVISGTMLNDQARALARERSAFARVGDEKQREALHKASAVKFIKSHPSSLLSIAELEISLSRGVPDISVVEPLFNGLSAQIKNSPEGKAYQQKLLGWKSVNIGSLAPDFSQPDEYNKPVKLSDLRGKYVLLDFWASWCHPCRDEHPNLIKQYGLYKDKGFTILSLSLDGGGFGTKAAWVKAIQDDGVGAWFHVCDLTGSGRNAIGKMYGVGSIPENFLIDPDGKIIAKSLRGIDLALELEKLFTNK